MPAEDAETSALAKAVGRRVEEERKRRDLTKEDLAVRCGLASRYLWRVEAGRQNTTLKILAALAGGLDLTISALTAGVEELAAKDLADRAREQHD